MVDDSFYARVEVEAREESIAEVVVDGRVRLQLGGTQTLTVQVELAVDAAQDSLPLVGGTPATLRAVLGRRSGAVVSVLRRRLSAAAAAASDSRRPAPAAVDRRRRRDDQQRDDVDQAQKRRCTSTQTAPHLVLTSERTIRRITCCPYRQQLNNSNV